MPVFTSKSDEKVTVGRKTLVAKTLRHLNPECAILAQTGEAGSEYAKNVNRARNTVKLREITELCPHPGCWADKYVGTFAEGVTVPANVAAKVSAAVAKKAATDAAAKKEGKAAKKAPKASKSAKAVSQASKVKAARKRKPKPVAPAAAAVEAPAEAAA